MNKVYIAGAHSRAATMGYYLTYLDAETEIVAYLYDNDEVNPLQINGVPVVKINNDSKLNKEYPVYLATRGVNHSHLRNTLIECGMKNIILVDVELDMSIRNKYLKKYFSSIGRKYAKIDDLFILQKSTKALPSSYLGRIYVACSAFDSELKTKYEYAEYESILQVGTVLTDKRLDTNYYDNLGENISEKNRQFCELTGLYWIWKNTTEDIVGLEHYRRRFILPIDWKEKMLSNDIDVILPVPLYVNPSIEENYKFRHVEANWNNMLQYIKEYYSEEYDDALSFFRECSLYSPCNMFIMKKDVLDDLCAWMFPILLFIAEKGGELYDKYQNRYPGFVSERLMTYFFEKHRDKYKVVYADKSFLE